MESFQPPYRIILNKRKYTRQIPSTTGHSHRLISNPRSIHGRFTFPIPSYPPIYLFTGCRCRRDAVPARSHERKSYEPKEKLRQWQGARPARSRAHVDVYARVKSSSLSLSLDYPPVHFSHNPRSSSSGFSASFSSFPESIFLLLTAARSRLTCACVDPRIHPLSLFSLTPLHSLPFSRCSYTKMYNMCTCTCMYIFLAAFERPAGGPRKFADLRIGRNIN